MLSVTDTGPGIEAEHLSQLWDRFYRVDKARSRAFGGSGLGLAIVKYIAEAHGGQAAVVSRPGHGTTFSIELPLAPAQADQDERAPLPPLAPSRHV
jgi:signal transduction histidine kinase